MQDEERQHQQELLQTYQRRLRVLEVQAAKFGSRTPPEILLEIEDTRANISQIESRLARDLPGNIAKETVSKEKLFLPTPNEPDTKVRATSNSGNSLSLKSNRDASQQSSFPLLVCPEIYKLPPGIGLQNDIFRREFGLLFGIGILLTIIGCLYVLLVVISIIYFGLFGTNINIIPLIILVTGISILITEFRKRDLLVQVTPDGIKHRLFGKVTMFSWDEIKTIQQGATHDTSPKVVYYILSGSNGKEINLGNDIEKIEQLRITIQREVMKVMMPRAINRYNAGQSVDYGKLSIDPWGLYVGTERVSWRRVKGVRYDVTTIWLNTRDELSERDIADTNDIPNFFVFVELVKLIVEHYR